MDIEIEIRRILEDNNDDTWQTKSIKALAICMLDIKKDICMLRKQIGWYKWLFATVIMLLLANLIK